ncbi:MAG: 2-oxoacid:acceptor oxidoreductase subunit alpha [Desulfovibrionaceae bacterium]|nr:2-oxoacid:acceptor oxidoreductase subunit alpha [Desulfovibrionaceae bacterium]
MNENGTNIVVGGAAGQGLATIGRLMSRAAVRAGYHLLVDQRYMSRVRGGHNTFGMRVGTEPLYGPAEGIDILVALNEETLELHRGELAEGAIVLAGEEIDTGGLNALRIPFKKLAPKPLFHNTVALGVLGATLCNDVAILEALLAETFAKKGEEVVRANVDVVRAAFEWVSEQAFDFSCIMPPEPDAPTRMMVNGNEAIALGALAAGCNFVSFYPMTPSTSVAQALIDKGAPLGLVHEQAEDEIAAANMAVGASYAGARALVTTSGGGFALMGEGVSLAGVSETPMVFVVAQRPGPATGMATRTEQGDLDLVVHAGHGEFPRAVLAPADPEQCFHLAHRAFDLAESFQTPVFLLTDQYLADSYRDVEPFDIDGLPPVARPMTEAEEGYKRYVLTEDGVSPRLVPGPSTPLVRADSHEHDEAGRITEDGMNRVVQNSKRLDKGFGLEDEVVDPDYYGEDAPDVLLLCWGSSLGACLDAMDRAETDKTMAVLHFSQVYPLCESLFLDDLEKAGTVVSVEGNATGQFAKLVARETGFQVDEYVLRFDGRPLTAEYVLAGLNGII